MFNSKSTDNLAFVSRQLSYLLDKEDIEPALRRLAEASPAEYTSDIGYLRNLLDGSAEPGPAPGPNPYKSIAKLLPAVHGAKNRLFREFVAYVQQSKVVFETYWAGVSGLVRYLAAVAVVAVIVAVVFSTSVIPAFDGLFSRFGTPLPDFTRAVFALGGAGMPLFAIVVALLVAGVGWAVALFHRRIQQLAPLPRWPGWAPVIGGIAESYNLGLFLNYARILRLCDVEPGKAVASAAAAANQPEDLSYESLVSDPPGTARNPMLTELGVAARLGSFDAEIIHQCDQHICNLSVALVEARDRFSLILKTALYLLVATLVVAMYLPIFKMGSVI